MQMKSIQKQVPILQTLFCGIYQNFELLFYFHYSKELFCQEWPEMMNSYQLQYLNLL